VPIPCVLKHAVAHTMIQCTCLSHDMHVQSSDVFPRGLPICCVASRWNLCIVCQCCRRSAGSNSESGKPALAAGYVQDTLLQLLPATLSELSAVIFPAQQQDNNARFQAYKGVPPLPQHRVGAQACMPSVVCLCGTLVRCFTADCHACPWHYLSVRYNWHQCKQ